MLYIITNICYNIYSGDLVAELCLTLATPWTVACQAPLSMGFSRQEYWSGLPFPSPGDLPNPGIEPGSPALQADSLPTQLQGKHFNILYIYIYIYTHTHIKYNAYSFTFNYVKFIINITHLCSTQFQKYTIMPSYCT